MHEFGSNPGLPFQQEKLNTNLPQVDAQEELDQGPPSNITPLHNQMSEYPKIRLRRVRTGLLYRPNAKETSEAEQERLVYRQSNDDMVKYEDLLEKIDEEHQAPEMPRAIKDANNAESDPQVVSHPADVAENAAPNK